MSTIIVITAPSGAGKTTIVRKLLAEMPELSFSVSATNRMKRHYETSGTDYYFLSNEAFEKKIVEGDFIEWEEVYPGQYYGTLKSEVERIWSEGKAAIFDIDVEGAKEIKRIYQEKAFTVFIMPPSREILTERLKKRKTENEEELAIRIEKASQEMDEMESFDLIVVNDDLDKAVQEIKEEIEHRLVH
ncbi:MAG: guanylate kinase [Chitinophagales bacterium]|nr:guanylate kinase [Chitinophagales bacterium]